MTEKKQVEKTTETQNNEVAKKVETSTNEIKFITCARKVRKERCLQFDTLETTGKIFSTITKKKLTIDPETLTLHIGKAPLKKGYYYIIDGEGNISAIYDEKTFTDFFDVM